MAKNQSKKRSVIESRMLHAVFALILALSGMLGAGTGEAEAAGSGSTAAVRVKLTSAIAKVTDGNRCYSLEGAEFTLYEDDACREVAKFENGRDAVLRTEADGTSPEYDIAAGVYYIKETKAPTGYAPELKISRVEAAGGKTTTYTAGNVPKLQHILTLLMKVDSEHDGGSRQGDASFKGAVYRFSYYDGYYGSEGEAASGGKPLAEWHFVTIDEKGVIYGDEDSLAEGYTSDKFYEDANGFPAFPLGTYVIREVKAPEGYNVSEEIKAVQITESSGNGPFVSTYNQKTACHEEIIKGGVKIAKIDRDRNSGRPQGGASLEGAEFTVYNKSLRPVTLGKGSGSVDVDEPVLVIRTGADGVAATGDRELPYGTYLVKETKAPEGYYPNEEWSRTFSVRGDGEVTDLSGEPVVEEVQRGGVRIQKVDGEHRDAKTRGDATLEGAEFTICNNSGESVMADGREYASGEAVTVIKTDADGRAATGDNVLPYGSYVIRETAPSKGYALNTTWVKEFEIMTPGEIVDLSDDPVEEPAIRGGIRVAKVDNDLDEASPQGGATLEGAEFSVYNKSGYSVIVDGEEHEDGAQVLVLKTDANGIAESAADALPYGTYHVKETRPSDGYLINTEWAVEFTIRENGVIVDAAESRVREKAVRGGVQIVKRDKELAKSEALGGAGLSGIVMTIRNTSDHDVVVRSDIGNAGDKVDWTKPGSKEELVGSGAIKTVRPGEDVGAIVTHWNEDKKAYTAETLADDLPYGNYTIRESKTNGSYQRTDKTEHRFEISEDGKLCTYESDGLEDALSFDNYVYRSDVQGTKIGDGDSGRFSYVPFRITSVSNGETHVVVADNNGFFSTKDRRTQDGLDEEEGADTARKQNPFDDLLEAEEIKTEELRARESEMLMGVWFGTGEFGSMAEPDPAAGALPYDSYVIEELPFDGNEGYTLQKFTFTVDGKSRNGLVDLETITNDRTEEPEKPQEPEEPQEPQEPLEPQGHEEPLQPREPQEPSIGTTLKDDKGNTEVVASERTTLVDTVEYKNLDKSRWYVITGTLMVKDTGEPLVEKGEKVTVTSKPFKPADTSGKEDVTFVIDTTELEGRELVAFETCYRLDNYEKGNDVSKAEKVQVAEHKDINDKGQTVVIVRMETPEIVVREAPPETDTPKDNPPAEKTPDENTPKGSPDTGNANLLLMYIVIMFTAAICLSAFAIRETFVKRRREKEFRDTIV